VGVGRPLVGDAAHGKEDSEDMAALRGRARAFVAACAEGAAA
jgi:hypothetical protein